MDTVILFLSQVDSARGRILYVSESVGQVLHYSQSDLFGQSLFDILHPKDVAKVKEQISSLDLTPRERLIDSKTMLPVKNSDAAAAAAASSHVPQQHELGRLSPGARRSFFCRMKAKSVKTEPTSSYGQDSPHPGTGPPSLQSARRSKRSPFVGKKYVVVQCTGYLKSWALTKIGVSSEDLTNTAVSGAPVDPEDSQSGSNSCMTCLVAVGRLQPSLDVAINDAIATDSRLVAGAEFSARLTVDGKFSYVDQRVTTLIGYLPQELLGTSVYEHVQYDDIPATSENHRKALRFGDEVRSGAFRFRAKDGRFVSLYARWKNFRNPWTKEIEYLVTRFFLGATAISSTSGAYGEEGGSSSDSSQLPGSNQSYTTATDLNFFSQQQQQLLSKGLGKDIQRVITSHAEASKIGRQIAQEVKRGLSLESDSSNSPPQSMGDAVVGSPLGPPAASGSGDCAAEPSTASNIVQEAFDALEKEQPGLLHSNSNTMLRAPGGTGGSRRRPMGNALINGSTAAAVGRIAGRSAIGDGEDDEAAMAVIMSLLEADAGLGGPVDFTGLPWPLS